MRIYKTTLKITVLSIITLTTLSVFSCGQDKALVNEEKTEQPHGKAHKIDSLITLYTQYDGFNGSVLVAHEDNVIYKKGFGLANMEWDIPNQVDTKFQIASVTKPFTAMLIMQLVAEKKLDLNEPISTYLPDYPKKNGGQITIHHLLTHSSGILRDSNGKEKAYKNPKEMVDLFADVALKFKPGEQFEYSNSGYTLLGYIIETIEDKTYEEVLKNRITTPLNMKNTGYYRHRPILKNMSSGYFKGFGDYFDIDYSDESSAYAAGAIYSTVEDLFLWDQALYNEKLLPKKYMDLVFTKHISAPDDIGYYGYGWELNKKPVGNTNEHIETIGHSGVISGYCAIITRIPSTKSSIILLNNTRRAYLNSITKAVTAILNDKPYDFPRKPLAKFMSNIIEKEGIEKGIMFYKQHKGSSEYYIDENELIVAGYRLLHNQNAKDAAKVFKLSIEVFPNRDNPYDSYAEALMAMGKNIEAIENYKKSLELNPNNKNAIKMLNKLGVD